MDAAGSKLVALIGDEDTVTGFVLAGVAHRTAANSNFLLVRQDTSVSSIEEAFTGFADRDDVAIILINQHIANEIRHLIQAHDKTIPTVLEIPSKDTPYDPEQDTIMQRITLMLGGKLPDMEDDSTATT